MCQKNKSRMFKVRGWDGMETENDCLLPNDVLCSKAAIREAIAGALGLVWVGKNDEGELLLSFSTHCPSSPSEPLESSSLRS